MLRLEEATSLEAVHRLVREVERRLREETGE